MLEKKLQLKKFEDKRFSIEERRLDYSKRIKKMMNPLSKNKFNPDTFEPAGEEMSSIANRKRLKPPKILPVFSLKPKEIREGQMIGMFESKQDLYLIFAHRCNEQQDELDSLNKEVELLKKQINDIIK